MSDTNSEEQRPFYGDAMAFFGFPTEVPRFEENILLDLAHVTCAPPVGPCAESLDMTIAACEQFKGELLKSGRVKIVTNAEDLDRKDGKINIVLGLQNLPMDENPFHGDRDFVRLRDHGIRVLALCYDRENHYGSGCLNLDRGLAIEGKFAIEAMANNGFILDLSHAGHHTAREALEFIDKKNLDIPVMASHGGCYAVYPHFRNLPDDVLAAIAERDGVVGIANLTFILGDRRDDDVTSFRRHLLHAVEVCGHRAVVIGSDAPYTIYAPEQEQDMFMKMKAMTDPHGTWRSRYPMYMPEFAGPGKMEKMKDPNDLSLPSCLISGLNLRSFFRRSLPK